MEYLGLSIFVTIVLFKDLLENYLNRGGGRFFSKSKNFSKK